jgi:integrase
MEKAVWWDIIASNPTHRTERPSQKRSVIQILQPEEASYFIQCAKADRLGVLFTFLLSNGPRPEECFGLQWPHLDLEKGKVQIGQVLKWNRTGGGWRLRDYPKTDAGRRVLTLDPPVVAMLQDWRKRQLEERLQAGRSYENNNLVFATPTGEPLYPTNVLRRHFRPLVIGSGLNPKLRVYDLRHTFATLSLLAGVDVKKLSYDMGHTRTSFTMDTYCHVVEQMHLIAAGKLESILWPKAAEG